jgi:hypothetical protein
MEDRARVLCHLLALTNGSTCWWTQVYCTHRPTIFVICQRALRKVVRWKLLQRFDAIACMYEGKSQQGRPFSAQ